MTSRAWWAVAFLAVIVMTTICCAPRAQAATADGPNFLTNFSYNAAPTQGQSAQIVIAPTSPAAVPSGSPTTYQIGFSCSAVGESDCGANPTITIPISDVQPSGVDPSTWTYAASSGTAGLITGQSFDAATDSYVITLDPDLVQPGSSYTLQFNVTQPNNTTPNGTTWQVTPSFSTSEIPATTVTTPATGEADAAAQIAVSKNTNDGSSNYVIGNTVIYTITARCNPGGSTGNLYLTQGSLVDTLPSYLTFVSATPAPTSVDSSTGTVTWNYPDSGSLPAGCSADGTGTTTYTMVTTLNSDTPDQQLVTNNVAFNGTPIDESQTTVTASKTIRALEVSPTLGTGFVSKSAVGPLNIANYGFAATYPGHWITPINPRPSNSPGSAEGEYRVNISYPASRAYETALADPVPCLDTVSSGVYSSNTPSGAITSDPTSVDNLCQHPAFHPTVVQVNSASLAQAVGGGWAPIGIKPDGTTFNLTLNGSAGTTSYFEVPSADVGNVAAILLPESTSLTDNSMSMYVYGYADASLQATDVLHDIATATAYPTSGTQSPVTGSYAANLYIEGADPQLGAYKTFGGVGSGAGGTTPLNISGHITAQAPLPGDVILTDLLPYGLSWANPSTSWKFTITSSAGASTQVTATVQDIANFNNSGQELIRVSIPSSAITSGYYTITPASGFINLNVPTGGQTYNNDIQEFVAGSGQNTQSQCGPGTTSNPSTFESSDPTNLSGTGVTNINYCQWEATLIVPPPSGPSFSLLKTVQGANDPSPVYPLGIGSTTQGGPATYGLTWKNTGSESLQNPVIYDILPYVGDTGVDQGQASQPRGSQFATIFTGVTTPLPTGVTVEYSTSTNPCRPEVYPNADNTGCDPNWTTTEPTPASSVTALMFVSSATYTPGQSFSVNFTVKLPDDQVNTVAWNSAATSAEQVGSSSYLLPASPPKVGITAPAPYRTPTLSTQTSAATVDPGTSVTDSVTIGNTGGGGGTLHWELLGPVTPNADGGCTGLDWTGAAVADQGDVTVAGDNTYQTGSTTVTDPGCYGYSNSLTGPVFASTVVGNPSDSNEQVLVTRTPTLSTQVSVAKIDQNDSVHDSVTIGNTGGGGGTLHWELLGPVAPSANGDCTGLDWTGAAVADQGDVTISGDNTYQTGDTTLTQAGCYGYANSLTGPTFAPTVVGNPSDSNEQVLVTRTPTLSTQVSSAKIDQGATVFDKVTVGNTATGGGTLHWELLGPVAPNASGGCTGLDWTGAAIADQGDITVTGDNTYQTPASTIAVQGCYGYLNSLTGPTFVSAVVSNPTDAHEQVLAVAPAQLEVTKRPNHTSVALGSPVTYTITVSNVGDTDAYGVNVTDTPQSPMSFVSAKPSQGTCDAKLPLNCMVGTVSAHGQVTVLVKVIPGAVGEISNSASVTPTNPSPPIHTHTKIKVHGALLIKKTASSGRVHAGGEVRFNVVVTNPYAVRVNNVTACDVMPAGLALVHSSLRTHLENGALCWSFSIRAHAHVTNTITTKALSGDACGWITNRANVSGSYLDTRRAQKTVRIICKRKPKTPVTG